MILILAAMSSLALAACTRPALVSTPPAGQPTAAQLAMSAASEATVVSEPTAPAQADTEAPAISLEPTPDFFGPPAVPLPAGVITTAPPALPPTAAGQRVLYVNGALHVWHVDEQRDQDLGWPNRILDCPWLAPDGRVLYFSDDEGAKRVDLVNPQPPELLLAHVTASPNPARRLRFCVQGQSDDGQRLLVQARDRQWYQWGVLETATSTLRVVESPFGPPGEPWYCPGAALWGQDDVLFVTGYSAGRCNQFPGLHLTRWGAPLAPSPVLTATLPPVGERQGQEAGAWFLARSPDGSQVAFWFDEGWAREDGAFLERALYTVQANGADPLRVGQAAPNGSGLPAWSEDSQSLYYVTSQPFDVLDPHPWQIHRLQVDDGADEVVAGLTARYVALAGPERAGRLLVTTLLDDLARYAVHVLDVPSRQVLDGPAQVQVLGWLP